MSYYAINGKLVAERDALKARVVELERKYLRFRAMASDGAREMSAERDALRAEVERLRQDIDRRELEWTEECRAQEHLLARAVEAFKQFAGCHWECARERGPGYFCDCGYEAALRDLAGGE
jgi:cell division protein FtsB